MKNYQTNRFPIIVFFIPIFLGLLFTYYYRESRRTLTERLVKSGVLALFDNGMVTHEDISRYFKNPPTNEYPDSSMDDSPILRALEMTLDDVSELDLEKPEWFSSPPGQRLIARIIKHIALIKYLNIQPDSQNQTAMDHETKGYREFLMIQRMEEDLAKVNPTITEEEKMDYYIKNPDEFFQEGKRQVRHIMVYDENDTANTPDDPFQTTPDQIRIRLESGEDFRKLVYKSKSDSAANEGVLGWLSHGMLTQEVDKEVWSMEVGEIRGPIKIGNTYHFVHLLKEQPEGLIPFEECKEKIRTILEEEKRALYRYKFLGLPEEVAYSPDPQYTQQYHQAMLKAAYAREWDKNMDIVQKSDAYTQYRKADALFKNYVDQLRQIRHLPKDTETTWMMEEESANKLLKKMKFRVLIKLNNTAFSNLPETAPDSSPEK